VKVTIEVTAEDISRGKPRSTCGCPVALAINRQLKLSETEHLITASVGRKFTQVLTLRRVLVFWFPDNVQIFIDRFDSDQPVKPFSFEFELELTDASRPR
jgi:hypothetical protein